MGYLDFGNPCDVSCEENSCRPNLPRVYADGVPKVTFVLNESLLLGIDLLGGEIQLGDMVVIVQVTSRTLPYGVVMYTNEFGSGWNAFTILGNGAAQGGTLNVVTPPANFTDFSMFPGDTPPVTGAWFAFTPNQIWTYQGGDAQWRYADRVSA